MVNAKTVEEDDWRSATEIYCVHVLHPNQWLTARRLSSRLDVSTGVPWPSGPHDERSTCQRHSRDRGSVCDATLPESILPLALSSLTC